MLYWSNVVLVCCTGSKMYWLKKNLPKIVLSPSLALLAWFVYGFILWTAYISLTKSKILPLKYKRNIR